LHLADSPSNRIDLVVCGTKDGLARGWYFAGKFLSDRQGEELSPSALLALASPENPLTLTLVPGGCGRRIGIDRDNDGWPDGTEIESGFDPADPASHGINMPPRLSLPTNFVAAHSGMILSFTESSLTNAPGQALTFSIISGAIPGATLDPITGLFQWPIPPDLSARQKGRLYVRVTDNAPPYLSDSAAIFLEAVPFRFLPSHLIRTDGFLLRWEAIAGQNYRLQYRTNLLQPAWIDWEAPIHAYSDEACEWTVGPYTDQKYFRLTLEP